MAQYFFVGRVTPNVLTILRHKQWFIQHLPFSVQCTTKMKNDLQFIYAFHLDLSFFFKSAVFLLWCTNDNSILQESLVTRIYRYQPHLIAIVTIHIVAPHSIETHTFNVNMCQQIDVLLWTSQTSTATTCIPLLCLMWF